MTIGRATTKLVVRYDVEKDNLRYYTRDDVLDTIAKEAEKRGGGRKSDFAANIDREHSIPERDRGMIRVATRGVFNKYHFQNKVFSYTLHELENPVKQKNDLSSQFKDTN